MMFGKIDTEKFPWWLPGSAKEALICAEEIVKDHHDDAAQARGEVSQAKFDLDREKELHGITKAELERTQEELAVARENLDKVVELAKEGLWRELEQEFQVARDAKAVFDRKMQSAARDMEILNTVAHNAVEAAVVRLHKYFSKHVADNADDFVMGTIPVMSVSEDTSGHRVLVDPDGPMARAILRAVAMKLKEMPEIEPDIKRVPQPLSVPKDPERLIPDQSFIKKLDEAEPAAQDEEE